MNPLTRMTKVDIIVAGKDAPAVWELIGAVGATGYTSVAGASGIGHHGQHSGSLLFNELDALTIVITVLPPDRAPALIDAARELLEDRSGVMFVADTFVSRPEYFQ